MDNMPNGDQIVLRWPFPPSNKIQNCSLWQLGSALVMPAVGILSKIMAEWLNTVNVHNRDILIDALDNRPKGTPLITVANHHSCLDDPMLWGMLDWRHILNHRIMRWTAAAHDICFTNDWHSRFFALGKTFPVIRGAGVYQKGMDFCLEQLNAGAWVHFFPEGKVNMAKNEFIRLKWGIGRLISECKICPIVIPFWHLGMDSVLPNVEPYRPKFGKKVTILIGNPMDLNPMREKLNHDHRSALWKLVMEKFLQNITRHVFSSINKATNIINLCQKKKVASFCF
ncbi:tafazzin isoform X1 [Parasteatoda tepidariorum]|uniref:tafazzin isoform X1 n=1 Tax=Parasteatoda tepidariorum TaxID=114398 RepID=UPI0039BC5146